MANPPPSSSDDNNPSAGTPASVASQSPTSNITQRSAGQERPNRRQQNPLSNFASYTYNFSLYMVTPDAYEGFQRSGRKNLSILNGASIQGDNITQGGGAFLIAQTGGINNATSQRAPGFELDYYIDDLEITTIPPNTSLKSTAGSTSLKFKIVEPYGFSLITNLIRANEFIKQYRPSPNNPTKQLYILGLKFTGYDDQGRILTGSENFGGTLDPTSTGNGVFEKYFEIIITEFKFKLDGKATNYFISASVLTDSAISTIRGFTKQSIKISGPTVNEVLTGERGLITVLNEKQQEYLNNGDIEFASTYKIDFDGDGAQAIAAASLLVPTQKNPYTFRLSPNDVNTTEDSNELATFVATPNVFSAEFSFVKDTSLVKLIENIVTNSTYLTDAMKIMNANSPEPTNGSLETIVQSNRVDVAWFSVTPLMSNPRWDRKQKIWIYDITYRIRKYETPIVLSPYVNPGTLYYGPHKIYDYWLTGNNNEVVSFEQQFDNLFFTGVVAGIPNGLQLTEVSNTDDTPFVAGASAGGAKLGSVNSGQSQDFQNTFITTLYDPSATVSAKITILGDPDYINQGEIESVNTLFNKFYEADGFTISYGGGQTFIEINFYEGQDYDTNNGLFKINDKIVFYQQSNVDNLVSGLSYQVVEVKHRFSQGKFTQVLDLKLNNFTFANLGAEGSARNPTDAAPSSGQTSSGGTTGSDGLKQDEPVTGGTVTEGVINSPVTPEAGTVPTGTGDVADGEISVPPTVNPDYDEGGREDFGDFGPFSP